MRTTLDIADDVLAAAKAIAREQKKTTGEVVSELARTGLRKPARLGSRSGVPILSVRNPDVRITLEMVNALRDETP
ncbi:MAG: CopG family transcriptional regulator [Hyphomicrobiales bacterium]|nr:CopG family transcriptional regulator [Hyphomicrobiales bacterium]